MIAVRIFLLLEYSTFYIFDQSKDTNNPKVLLQLLFKQLMADTAFETELVFAATVFQLDQSLCFQAVRCLNTSFLPSSYQGVVFWGEGLQEADGPFAE